MKTSAVGFRYWLLTGAAVLAACAVGFFSARITNPLSEPAASVAPAKEAQENSVRVKPADMAAMGILTEPVAPGSLSTEIIGPATVDAEIQGEGVLTAHVSGTVTSITKRLGDPVKTGEVLAIVESREAATMASQRDIAQSKVALARSTAAREKELFDKLVTPRQDLERAQSDLEAAEAELRRAQAAMEAEHVTGDGKAVSIVSPLSGAVTSRTAALGLFVRPETELFRVSDPRFIDVDVAVLAIDAQRVAVGDPARVLTRSGASVRAVVRSVTPTVNEQTRSATVVLDPQPGQQPLTPGEVVQAIITPKNAAPVGFIVPEDAVQNVGGRTVVFVRSADGFRVQPVAVGARVTGRATILSGLSAGEEVATANAFFLKAELNKGAGENQ
jgi:cobalt-zinc-cadmium efflux system membrane fusion protein